MKSESTENSPIGGFLRTRFIAVMAVVIVFILGLGYFFYGLQPTLVPGLKYELKISRGDSFRKIGATLSQESLIRSITVFKLYSFLTGRADQFKPGIYNLNSSMSVPQVVNKISIGGQNEVRVTIPEGLTIKDTDKILKSKEVINEDESVAKISIKPFAGEYPFLKEVNSFEGFLFPDTYFFHINSKPEEVVVKLLDNFEEKIWSKLKTKTNWYDKLILASYLEKEVKTAEDRKIVAGILLKRLEAGAPLQVDATISYAKCDGAMLGCDRLKVYKKDTEEIASPYNTYQRIGWTPTPIANPGVNAIKASLNPKATPYWYYLSTKETGETIFSRTLKEHNINRAKYL